MTSFKYAYLLAATFTGIAIMSNAACAQEGAAKPAVAKVAVADGRSGWDVVGQAAPTARAMPMAADPQARKREMVRRMFVLMVAYR